MAQSKMMAPHTATYSMILSFSIFISVWPARPVFHFPVFLPCYDKALDSFRSDMVKLAKLTQVNSEVSYPRYSLGVHLGQCFLCVLFLLETHLLRSVAVSKCFNAVASWYMPVGVVRHTGNKCNKKGLWQILYSCFQTTPTNLGARSKYSRIAIASV